MGFFDRFTSRKGKDQTTGPKRGVVKEAKKQDSDKKAFASVPAAQDAPVKAKEKGKEKPTKAAATVTRSATAHLAHRVLIRPIVTEKSTRGGAQSQYTFEVATRATKADVQESVHHLYGVKPVAVNVMSVRGKVVRFGRTYGRTINRKKAVVTLPAGKTIDVVSV